jgi:hypothetical protein
MGETLLAEELSFLQRHREEDEAVILARAVREGVDALYREALVEAYLLGRVPRMRLLQEIGQEALEDVEYQRDVLRRDVAWGLRGR